MTKLTRIEITIYGEDKGAYKNYTLSPEEKLKTFDEAIDYLEAQRDDFVDGTEDHDCHRGPEDGCVCDN